jgi:hypothetical protein
MEMRAFAIGLVVTCLSCASKPPPAAAPTSSAPAAAAVAAEAAPDLSPVPAPEDLVVVGRLSRPRLLIETIAGWAGVPVRLSDLLPSELRGVDAVLAWDAPVEFAAVLDRHSTAKVAPPLVVVSFGLTSLPRALDLARDRGVSPTRVAPSVYRLPIDEEVTCALSAAVGAAPARLVCGTEWQGVEELLPYATRGLPNENLGDDDLHLELRGSPLQRKYSQEIAAVRLLTGLLLRQGQSDSPRLDRVLTEAAYALADELKALASEADRVEIRARLDEAKKSLEIGGAVSFAKDGSFTAQMMQDTGKRSAPPPAAFWDLPRSGDSAGYSVGSDPKRLAPLANVGIELADAFLEQQKAPASLRQHVRGVIAALPAFVAPEVHVHGTASLPKQPTLVDRTNQRVGWGVTVVEQRADQLTKLLSEVQGLLADPALPKVMKERFSIEAKRLPKLRQRVVKVAGFAPRGTAFTLELPAALLESLESLEDSAKKAEPPKGKRAAAGPSAFISVVLVADGEKTWASFASDEKSALARLESARAGREGKLADLPELAPLRQGSYAAAGFSTLVGIVRSLESALPKRARDTAELFSHAQNQGRTPVLSLVSVTQRGSGVKASVALRIPEGTFQDLGGIVPWLISSGSP